METKKINVRMKRLDVQCNSMFFNSFRFHHFSVPPSLVSSAANVTKTVGESVKFECSFNGIPNPDIQWFYVSGGSMVQLQQTNHYVISAGSLEIRQITKKDEGRYICRAVNVAGRLESSAFLRVKGIYVSSVANFDAVWH